jgi:hypothetical protein
MGPASGEDEGPDEQPGTASTSNDHADDDHADDDEDHGGDDDHAGDNGDADDADEAVLLEANGCPSGFEALRAGFVAGHADRLVRSNSYVPLLCSYRAVTTHDRMRLTRMINKLGVPRSQAFEQVSGFLDRLDRGIGAFEERVAALGEPEPDGDGPSRLARAGGMREALSIANQAFAETVREAPRRDGVDKIEREGEGGEGGEGGEATRVAERPGVGEVTYGVVQPPVPDAPALDPTQAFRDYEGVTATTLGTHLGVQHGIVKYVNLGWLGILFQDRLRFRPAGLVAGDQVFSLSLAPGEEATLTQRSETKRSRSFEEILDKEVERQLEFSSTWTTDFSQADTSTESSTTSGNLGIGIGIPIEGVNVNVNAAVSATDANSTSKTTQRGRNQEVTARVTAKAREQHKTTFKVGTDVTEELGSKRVLRNANPSRALTLNVYKLYQKYRILLERWDAKLCVSLGLYDPGRDLRAELEEELAKLDPHVPAGACPDMPVGATITQSKVIDNLNATEVGTDEYGFEMFSTVLPPGTVLSDWAFDITSWTVDPGDGNTYLADVSQFFTFGGKWWFRSDVDVPVIGSAGAQSNVVNVLMPEAWGPGWWTVKVTGRMTWTTVPAEAITTEVRTCIDAEKKKVLDSFSADRVMQILEEVSAARRELVFKRLFEEVLLPGYFAQGINPPMDVLERLRNFFDWNEATIEYVPWWMTATGRERREQLRQRLLKLPGDTRSDLIIDDFLIASMARVYLPVKRGMEAEAVAFLLKVGGYSVPSLDACIDDFIAWREAQLGPITYPLPTYDQVLSSGPEVATAAGSAAWAHDWEKPRRKFLVLDEWSDLLPTDGVHLEPALSTCGSVDEYRASALVSDLEGAAALRQAEAARAELERALAADKNLHPTIVIGDPAIRPPLP